MQQITNTILMVRPVGFRKNEQTAVNNYFQEDVELSASVVIEKAQKEFDDFVLVLRDKGIQVVVIEDTKKPDTPDAIFPNNWISFHANGTVALYPMYAENRRQERREDVLEILEDKGLVIENIVDYTSAEEEAVYLEGTGSLLLDRVHKKAYCSLSDRANEDLFIEFCEDFDYFPVQFRSYQSVEQKRELIYHTNVMMCLASDFAIICLESIDDKKERKNVVHHLKETGKEVISISEKQMHQFAGNMLQLVGSKGQKFLVMSTTAYNSLQDNQIKKINGYCQILHSPLNTIETCGGGSARCMMAEVFLPKKTK